MNQRLLPITSRRWRTAVAAILTSILAAIPFAGLGGIVSAAACTPPATDYGTATTSVSVPAAATYRIWTRINVPDTTNNTYLLEIDGNKCYSVGGGSIATNSWVWIAHQNGTVSSKIDVSLTQGNHSLKLIGNKPGVKVDRLVFASDLACVPTGNGDNCNVPSDTTAPSVRIASPSASAEVGGTVPITVTASDNVGVTKVELYVNSSLLGTDTTTPYAFQWDTTKIPNGGQLLTAKAYDGSGNVGIDSITVNVENGDKNAPSTPSDLSAKATAYNTVVVSWKASTDDTGVKGYTVFRDGVPIATIGNVTTYTDSSLLPNTSYSYKVLAFDAAGNKSPTSTAVTAKTPNVADSVAPSNPTNLVATAVNQTQINLAWTASTDNIGVTKYDVYRGTGDAEATMIGSSPTPSYGDTNLSPNTTYSYYVIAKDASDNSSGPSPTVSAKTKPVVKLHSIRGLITNQADGRFIGYASVTYTVNGKKRISQANSRGRYAIQRLEAGRYNLTFKAEKYFSKTTSVKLVDQTVVKDITLQKRK